MVKAVIKRPTPSPINKPAAGCSIAIPIPRPRNKPAGIKKLDLFFINEASSSFYKKTLATIQNLISILPQIQKMNSNFLPKCLYINSFGHLNVNLV